MIWLCITAVLFITPLVCGLNIDISHIKVFPAMNQSIAGVFHVSHVNFNQPQYAFNASDARKVCVALGVSMASKAQVQAALTRGLETCRFGWIDEHLAVIPRINAVSNCGRNQKGLVVWRASVTQKFDVFCFNQSDAATQLEDTTPETPVTSSHLTQTQSTSDSTKTLHSSSSPPTSSSSVPETADDEAEPARFVGSAGGSARVKAIVIASTCVLLLVAVIILAYIKMRGSCSDKKQQQQEYIQTEEWTCVTTVKETKKAAQEDEGIEVGDEAS